MRSIDGEVFPAAAHGQAVLRTTSQALRASSPSRGASGETVHFAGTAKASPTRSCWGRGQQDASDSAADAGSRNPGSGIASAMTERLG